MKYLKLFEQYISDNPIIIPSFDTEQIPDLNLALDLPQVGSKRYRFDIIDSKIVSDELLPDTLYDYVITTSGELIIGSQHYRMSKKSKQIKVSGELKINREGKISYLNNESGHYKPSKELLRLVIPYFRKENLLSDDFIPEFRY